MNVNPVAKSMADEAAARRRRMESGQPRPTTLAAPLPRPPLIPPPASPPASTFEADLELIRQAFAKKAPGSVRGAPDVPWMSSALAAYAKILGIEVAELSNKSREQRVVLMRQAFFIVCVREHNAPARQCATETNRTHSAVLQMLSRKVGAREPVLEALKRVARRAIDEAKR